MRQTQPSPRFDRCFGFTSHLYRISVNPKYLNDSRVQLWLSTQETFFELLEPYGKHAFYPSEFGEKGVYFFETCLENQLLEDTLASFKRVSFVEHVSDFATDERAKAMQSLFDVFTKPQKELVSQK